LQDNEWLIKSRRGFGNVTAAYLARADTFHLNWDINFQLVHATCTSANKGACLLEIMDIQSPFAKIIYLQIIGHSATLMITLRIHLSMTSVRETNKPITANLLLTKKENSHKFDISREFVWWWLGQLRKVSQ
jgi:hypothetical protein